MEVAVLGGSGVAGSYTVAALREAGHTVRQVSRRTGVDVYTGEGLAGAFAGVDVIVDTLNTSTLRRAAATEFFVTTARRVQAAAEAQGVGHVVLLSIIGIDRVRGYGYYDAKIAQEETATAGPVPVTVLRATQFHEFPGQMLARMRIGPVAFMPRLRSQPVAARTVGLHLARLAVQRPGGVVELAGPDVHDVADLARRLVHARGERLHVVALELPGKVGRDTRAGGLLATDATILDGPSYDDWLRSADARTPSLVRRPEASHTHQTGSST